MFPISSPRVPSTCGSSLVTPVARTKKLDAGASAACHASPATPRLPRLPATLPPRPRMPRLPPRSIRVPPQWLALCRDHILPCCMCRLCHACLLATIAFCLHCLLFLRLPPLLLQVLRTLPFIRPILTSLALSTCVGIVRALGPSLGPGMTIGDARLRTHRPRFAVGFCRRGVRVSYVPTTFCPVCLLRLEGLGLRLRKKKKLGTSVCGLSFSAACEDQNSVRRGL